MRTFQENDIIDDSAGMYQESRKFLNQITDGNKNLRRQTVETRKLIDNSIEFIKRLPPLNYESLLRNREGE